MAEIIIISSGSESDTDTEDDGVHDKADGMRVKADLDCSAEFVDLTYCCESPPSKRCRKAVKRSPVDVVNLCSEDDLPLKPIVDPEQVEEVKTKRSYQSSYILESHQDISSERKTSPILSSNIEESKLGIQFDPVDKAGEEDKKCVDEKDYKQFGEYSVSSPEAIEWKRSSSASPNSSISLSLSNSCSVDRLPNCASDTPPLPTVATQERIGVKGNLESPDHSSEIGEHSSDKNNISSDMDRWNPHSPLPNMSSHRTSCIDWGDQSSPSPPITPRPSYPPSPDVASPTSTDILAGDSPDWVADDAELPSDSTTSPLSLTSSEWGNGNITGSQSGSSSPNDALGSLEASHSDHHYVSPVAFRKLILSSLRTPCHGIFNNANEEVDETEASSAVRPLCRSNVNDVNSTIEENYPEGTLQLLSDFLHPHIYPPPHVMRHLILHILLQPQSPTSFVSDAYGLLMRVQKYHPANVSTVQWDWELLTSVMNPKEAKKTLPPRVRRLLLQYILATLEDDFSVCLSSQRLQHSITHKMFSITERFCNVRDVIQWLVTAVINSKETPVGQAGQTEEKEVKERDENLQIVLLLQKVLALAMEVDNTPNNSCNKLSNELFYKLLSSVHQRRHRLLLLETLASSLLKHKLLQLLLDHCNPHKTQMPMSLCFVLHLFQHSTPSPDPADGAEKERRWSELIHLLLMLLLSYEAVRDDHLRVPITERGNHQRAPIHTIHDHIKPSDVQEAAEAFKSHVFADLGHALPPPLEEYFTCLLDQLQDACNH